MAGLWSVIVPTDATNLCPNPSAETSVSDYPAVAGGVVSRSSTRTKFGSWSAKCVITSASDGIDTPTLSTTGTIYMRAWVYVQINEQLGVYTRKDGSDTLLQTITGIDDGTGGSWHRLSATVTGISTSILWRFLGATSSQTIYVDGVQYSASNIVYIDGDQPGCVWDGAAHASTSSTTTQNRNAGIEYNFDTLGVAVNDMTPSGTGMPSIQNNYIQSANLDGAQYNGYSVGPRSFSLSLSMVGNNLNDLHSIREDFINTIKPDITGTAQPFWLWYSSVDGKERIGTKCIYAGGLEMTPAEGYTEVTDIRLTALDPYWYEEGNAADDLEFLQQSSNMNLFLRDKTGVWIPYALGSGSDSVAAIEIGKESTIYAIYGGGTTWEYGVYSTASASWTTGLVLDAPSPITNLRGMKFGQDGKLYAWGTYDSGPSFGFVSVFDGATYEGGYTGGTWTQIGNFTKTAANAHVYDLVAGDDGYLYVGGDFDTESSDSISANFAMRYSISGDAWSALVNDPSNVIKSMVIDDDSTIYAVVDSATDTIERYSSGAWTDFGTGISGTLSKIAKSNHRLYATNQAPALYVLNGLVWSEITGLPEYSTVIGDDNGLLTIGGYQWNGYSYLQIPVDTDGATVINSVKSDLRGRLVLGLNEIATTVYLPSQNVVPMSNNRAVNPIVKLKCTSGPATLYNIRNDVTKRIMYINYTLQTGETMTINTDPINFGAVSSFYGDVTGRALLRGGDFSQFKLLPISNRISLFIPIGTVEASLEWPLRHWSSDGIAT